MLDGKIFRNIVPKGIRISDLDDLAGITKASQSSLERQNERNKTPNKVLPVCGGDVITAYDMAALANQRRYDGKLLFSNWGHQ